MDSGRNVEREGRAAGEERKREHGSNLALLEIASEPKKFRLASRRLYKLQAEIG